MLHDPDAEILVPFENQPAADDVMEKGQGGGIQHPDVDREVQGLLQAACRLRRDAPGRFWLVVRQEYTDVDVVERRVFDKGAVDIGELDILLPGECAGKMVEDGGFLGGGRLVRGRFDLTSPSRSMVIQREIPNNVELVVNLV